mgnify:CR=1 FL=1
MRFSHAFRDRMPLIWLAVLAVYVLLNTRYNIYYVDDPWMISNAWNYVKLGIPADLIFIESDRPGHFQFFGLTYYWVLGSVLEMLGWTKSNAFLVNSVFVWATALVWWSILKDFPISDKISKWVVLFIPIFPPFFFAAHGGRTEAFLLLLVSIQLWFFIRNRFFISAFLIGLSIEVHLMGILGLFYNLGYALMRKEEYFFDKKAFGKMILKSFYGIALAVGYYFWLHGDYFSVEELSQIFKGKRDMSTPTNNYILAYFADFDWYAHIWEFAVMIVVLVQYFKNRLFKKNPQLALFFLVIFLSTIITRRENRNYLVLIFPAFLMLYFYTYSEIGKLKGFLKTLAVLLILHYSAHYFINKDFHFEDITRNISRALRKDIPVIGMPDIWFAAQNKNFCPIHHGRNFERLNLDNFYLVQTDYLAHRNRDYFAFIEYFKSNFQYHSVRRIEAGGRGEVLIWDCRKIIRDLPKFEKPPNPGWKAIAEKYLEAIFRVFESKKEARFMSCCK